MSLVLIVLLVVALVCFALASFGRVHSRVDLVSLGLFFTVLSIFLKALTGV